MTTIESVLDRIKKLLAHSESAAGLGSQAEAEAFAAKAAEIALQHKLSLDAIEFADEEEADPIGDEYVNQADLAGAKNTRNRSAWMERLMSALTRNNSCRILVIPGSKTVRIVGSSSDRAIVKYLFAVLAKEGSRLAAAHARAVAKTKTPEERYWRQRRESPRTDFLLGYVDGIRVKLAEQRRSTLAEAGQYAVVRVQTHESKVQAMVDEWSSGKASGVSSRVGNTASYNAGRSAGLSANTNGGIGGGTVSRASSMRLSA